MNPVAVLPLGDNQYYCGGLAAFQTAYDPTWGRLKAITRPVVGNHEYLVSGGTGCDASNAAAAGYFTYFGAAAGQPGQGYYSYNIGQWHLIAINSNCGDAGGCSASSPQGKWLAADLAANQNLCTLAYWHIPLYSSGGRANANTSSVWSQLYNGGADVVLAGHDHTYERFARQTNGAVRDDRLGIREFVVGTGGANHTSFVSTAANSEVRNANTFGVLKLTLHPDSFDWQFVPEVAGTFTDSGTETCHGRPSDTTPPTMPTGLAASASGPTAIDLTWTASTDATGVAKYTVERDGTVVGTSTTTSYRDTAATPGVTHSYRVSAVDYNGLTSAPAGPVVIGGPPDTTPPSTPTGLAATSVQANQVSLSWTASTDNGTVTSYRVFRGGTLVGTSTTTTFVDATVAPGTTYSYAVSAVDQSNNESGRSAALSVTTPALPTSITLNPVADTYVRADLATTSFGTDAAIGVDGSPAKRALLRFNVQGVAGRPVRKAVLRLWCTDSATVGGVLHALPDSNWTEAVTWNTAPTAATATVASLGSVQPGFWYEMDVTSLVTADGLVSMDMTSASSNGADYSSREAAAAQRPQLVITAG
jgi:chitodextrinase